MRLNPDIWGPHVWFSLYTIILSYPKKPNDVIKKKYYDFIQNLPVFLPDEKIGNNFSKYLDKYPVTPYLDSNISLFKWMNFIHNEINIHLGKDIIPYEKALNEYYQHYEPKKKKNIYKRHKKKLLFGCVCFVLLFFTIYLIRN